MARYLKKLSLFLLLQALLALVVWNFPASNERDDRYLAVLADKHDLLLHRPGPRLILVGGSNVSFGISSPQLKAQLPFEPINMGCMAGLHVDFMLNHVESHVRSGDVVILSPETHILCLPLAPRQKEIDDTLAAWPQAADYFPAEYMPPRDAAWKQTLAEWRSFIDRDALQKLGYRAGLFRRYVTGRRTPQMPNVAPPGTNPYSRSGFNEFGDIVAHYSRDPVPYELFPIALHEENLARVIDRINAFGDACRSRGVKVFFSFSPMAEEMQESAGDELRRIHNRLVAELTVPVLHRPEDVVYPRDHFYDTPLHLSRRGTERRTQLLIDRLNQTLPIASRAADSRRL